MEARTSAPPGRHSLVMRLPLSGLVVTALLILVGLQSVRVPKYDTPRPSMALEATAALTSPPTAHLPHLLQVFTGHRAAINSVAWSPDGRSFLTGSDDTTARVWDLSTGKVVHDLRGQHSGVQSVAWSPDGRFALSGSTDSTAIVWDTATGHLIRQFGGHRGSVNAVAFSADGKQVVTGSQDGTARVWDVPTGQLVHTLTQPGSVRTVAFDYAEEGALLTGGGDGRARVWNTRTGMLLKSFDGRASPIHAVAFRRDCMGGACWNSEMLSAGEDGTAVLWDEQGSAHSVLSSQHGPVRSLGVSPDGDFVVTGYADETADLWSINVSSGRPDTFSGRLIGSFGNHSGPINSVAFSPDELYILTGHADGTAALWSFYDVVGFYPHDHQRMFSRVSGLSFIDPLNGWALVGRTFPMLFPEVNPHPALRIRVTHDGGQTWQPLALAPPGVTNLRFANLNDGWAFASDVDFRRNPSPKDRVDNLWSTHDGGSTWEHVPVKKFGPVTDLWPMGRTVWVIEQQCPVGEDCPKDASNVLLKSEDGGQTWQTLTAGVPMRHPVLLSPQIAMYESYYPNSAQPGFFVLTPNGGRSWRTLPNPCGEWYDALAMRSPRELWAICVLAQGTQDDEPKEVYATADGGAHWQMISYSELPGQIQDMGTPTGLVFTSATRGFALFERRGIWMTSDGGHTWTKHGFDNDRDWEYYGGGLTDLTFIDAMHGWFRTRDWGDIYRTTDGGEHWEAMFVP